jgi:hypothetical protein
MSRGFVFSAWAAAVCVLIAASPSHANNPNVVKPADYASTSAARYAGMDAATCMQQLAQRQVPHEAAAAVAGVDAPVRITGLLHGIKLTLINRAPDEARNADAAVTDCRLALAVDELAAKLAGKKVVEIGFISAYRKDDTGKVKAGERHPAGLAIDVAWMKTDDGREVNVKKDFHGRIGARTCGQRAEQPKTRTDGTSLLREIICEAAGERMFNLVLTPNYDQAHHDHVHFEVRRNIDWILVQ